MAISNDTDDLLGVWGQTLTIMRKAATYANTGDEAIAWSSQGTASGDIQPAGGDTARREAGDQVKSTHEIYFPNGANVLEGDRIRLAGFVAGDDEYQVRHVASHDSSHVVARCILVKGHGG